MIDERAVDGALLPAADGRVEHGDARAAPTCASSRATSGRMVLQSTTIDPAARCSSTPSGPATTAATSGESGSIVMTTSAPSVASASVSA